MIRKIKPDDEVVTVKRSILGKGGHGTSLWRSWYLTWTWLMCRISLQKTQWGALQAGRLGSVKSLRFEIPGLTGETERRPEWLGHSKQVLWSYGRGWDCLGKEGSNHGGLFVVGRSLDFILIAVRSQWRWLLPTLGGAEWVDTVKHLAQCLLVNCSTYCYSTFIYTFYYYTYTISSLNAGLYCPILLLSLYSET